MNVDQLLDKCREVCGVRTDVELANRLRVSKQAVSGWRNGHRLPDAVTCATIAGLTGEPLARVIGVIEEARAVSREEKAVWRKLAASAALIACLVLHPIDQVRADVGVSQSVAGCIMRKYEDGEATASGRPNHPHRGSMMISGSSSRPLALTE